MHILLVNDDGPPSNKSSPYVHSLISALQANSHTVSVVLPHTQRSWIGKAHFVAETAKPSYFRPGTLHQDDGTVHELPLQADEEGEEWVLIDGTPATCAQLGLYYFFQDRGPVDLVISGPNYGRNSTALFCLSSGTIGGAMEAAVCGKKAIALSYAFFSRDHDPEIIAGASRLAVRITENLMKNWGNDVDLYSINVPLVKGVESNKVMFTQCLSNVWTSGSSYTEVGPGELDAEHREQEIREQEVRDKKEPEKNGTNSRHRHRHFKWAPHFQDVYKSAMQAGPGHDGWTINEGMTSITPMKAKFAEAQAHPIGELKLSPSDQLKENKVQVYIAYEDPYVQPLILSALSTLPAESFQVQHSLPQEISSLYLQIAPYELLNHDALLSDQKYIGNAYTIRKALIRKHYLANTVASWLPKNPNSRLKSHVPLTIPFELDYAEFLDDALLEAWELHESWSRNQESQSPEREWWILKPGMSDRGQGIRLFSSEEELTNIFEEWEAENPEDEEDELEGEEQTSKPSQDESSKGLITSQLRHFIAQPYIPPLLLEAHSNRKFHIRTYVLCVGALSVYVYKDMLALFATETYVPPQSSDESDDSNITDMRRHLTNTCLQDGFRDGSVLRYWDLETSENKVLSSAFEDICETTGELFRAAIANPTNFQPLPNAFEVFGVDWLLDGSGKPWLLEVNAFPDFKQTGDDLSEVVAGFWRGVLRIVGKRLLDLDVTGCTDKDGGMVKVLDVDLGRR